MVELGRAQKPFLATLVSITNHLPFHVPEAQFKGPGDSSRDRLHDTMRYTDDVCLRSG